MPFLNRQTLPSTFVNHHYEQAFTTPHTVRRTIPAVSYHHPHQYNLFSHTNMSSSDIPIPFSSIALLLLACYSLLICASGAFTEDHLRGPVVRRYGITSCPDNMFIDSESFNFSSTSIFVNEQACTSGTFTLNLSPSQAPSGGALAPYLSSTRGVGQIVGLDVSTSITCPDATFQERSYLTFVRPDSNVTIDWRLVYSRNDTVLQIASNSPTYTFYANVTYVVVNSICLYSSMTEKEIDEQRPEACFPRSARVSAPLRSPRNAPISRQLVPIGSLKVGDLVHIGGDKISRIIAWTHKDVYRVAPFVRITTANGLRLKVSHGHYVYANHQLLPARKIKPGMIMRLAYEPDSPVVSAETVWQVGLFNPHTIHGDIVVDGFICSTYTEAVPPLIAHALLAPIRFVTPTALSVIKRFFHS